MELKTVSYCLAIIHPPHRLLALKQEAQRALEAEDTDRETSYGILGA